MGKCFFKSQPGISQHKFAKLDTTEGIIDELKAINGLYVSLYDRRMGIMFVIGRHLTASYLIY